MVFQYPCCCCCDSPSSCGGLHFTFPPPSSHSPKDECAIPSTRHPPLLNHGPCRHQLCVPLWGSEETTSSMHIHDTRCAVRGSRAQTHGLESATRPIDGGMALHRSQRRVWVQWEAQAGSGMSRAPINAPMTVQAPRECWRVSCRDVRECCVVLVPVVFVPLMSVPTSLSPHPPSRPHANPRMMMQTFQYSLWAVCGTA